MILALAIEDDKQAINLLTEMTTTTTAKMTEVIKKLEELFIHEQNEVSLKEEILQHLFVITKINRKVQESNRPLEKLKLTYKISVEIRKLKVKLQEQVTDDFLKEIKQIEFNIQELEKVLALLSSLKAICSISEDYLVYFKELYESLFFLLEILEKEALTEYSSSLKILGNNLKKVIFMRNLRQIYLLVDEPQQQELRKYVCSTISTSKAILWEIEQHKISQKRTLTETSIRELVIEDQSYEELIKESKKRIHLLGED